MAKPTRSPLLGYNHNVKYRGRIFHVQTEDSGPTNPHLFTHLYYEGTILATKKHTYDGTVPEDVVRALMQSQHKAILKELKSRVHDERILRFFMARGETLPPPAAAAEGDGRTLDLDALTPAPTPVPVLVERERSETHGIVAHEAPVTPPPVPTGPGVYAMKGVAPETPFEAGAVAPAEASEAARSPTPPVVVLPPSAKRPQRTTTPPVAGAVVVQRTVVVGGGAGGSGPPGHPAHIPPRVRRPAQAIPYVVKEGSHPLASQPSSQATPPPELPPARPIAPAPVTAATAPRTTGTPAKGPHGEPLVEKSLDEVILAYLAQGGEGEPG